MSKSDPKRLLVVDDDELVLDLVCRYLSRVGYACTACTTGTRGAKQRHRKLVGRWRRRVFLRIHAVLDRFEAMGGARDGAFVAAPRGD